MSSDGGGSSSRISCHNFGVEMMLLGSQYAVFPMACDLKKWPSLCVLSSFPRSETTNESRVLSEGSRHIRNLSKANAACQGALVFLSKDYEIENQNPLASPTNTLLGSAKEQRYQRGLERNDSWGSFDLRAAIVYHTKGNYLFLIQKFLPANLF